MRFAVKLSKDTDGTILVSFPDFPEAATFGEDREDALARAVDALETAIQGRISDREDIPEPTARGRQWVTLPTQAAVKVLLYRTMLERGVSKAKLARDLHLHRPQIDRLLDLRHPSRLDQIDAAMREMDSGIEVRAI